MDQSKKLNKYKEKEASSQSFLFEVFLAPGLFTTER